MGEDFTKFVSKPMSPEVIAAFSHPEAAKPLALQITDEVEQIIASGGATRQHNVDLFLKLVVVSPAHRNYLSFSFIQNKFSYNLEQDQKELVEDFCVAVWKSADSDAVGRIAARLCQLEGVPCPAVLSQYSKHSITTSGLMPQALIDLSATAVVAQAVELSKNGLAPFT